MSSIIIILFPFKVIHLDGAFARPRHLTLSAGNCTHDLNIMSNTIVRTIKEHEINPLISVENFTTVSIEESGKSEGLIRK